jgi:hypothetical protein
MKKMMITLFMVSTVSVELIGQSAFPSPWKTASAFSVIHLDNNSDRYNQNWMLLNTATGQVYIISYGTANPKNYANPSDVLPKRYTINDKSLLAPGDDPIPGRFVLFQAHWTDTLQGGVPQSGTNGWLLLDQQTGATWAYTSNGFLVTSAQ